MILNIATFIERSKSNIKEISCTELNAQLSEILVIDVREKADFNKGHIVDALHIPFSKLKERAEELSKNQDKAIIIVDACRCRYRGWRRSNGWRC